MLTTRQSTELKQYFAIKSDLSAAFRAGNAEDAGFHMDELHVIQLHTESDRLKAACEAAVREFRRLAIPKIA